MAGYNFDFFRTKLKEIKMYLTTTATLGSIFKPSFYSKVLSDVDAMEKDNNPMGNLPTMYLFFLNDSLKGFVKSPELEEKLELMFSRCSSNDRKYIISELAGKNAINMLFEINVLSNLLENVPADRIVLFPRTEGKKNVEAKILLEDRWIFLEATMLRMSDKDKNEMEADYKSGNYSRGGWIDIPATIYRFSGKVGYKTYQFSAGCPNVLLISNFDPNLVSLFREWSDEKVCHRNIGAVFEFEREALMREAIANCDPSCRLTPDELGRLKKLFSLPAYKPVVY